MLCSLFESSQSWPWPSVPSHPATLCSTFVQVKHQPTKASFFISQVSTSARGGGRLCQTCVKIWITTLGLKILKIMKRFAESWVAVISTDVNKDCTDGTRPDPRVKVRSVGFTDAWCIKPSLHPRWWYVEEENIITVKPAKSLPACSYSPVRSQQLNCTCQPEEGGCDEHRRDIVRKSSDIYNFNERKHWKHCFSGLFVCFFKCASMFV